MSPETIAARALRRIRNELDERGISQRDLAEKLTGSTREEWSQSRIGKVLTGYVELKVDDAAAIATAIGLSLTEVVRDQGLEFYAEMTPTEVRIIDRIRRWPDLVPALTVMLDIATKPAAVVPKQDTKRKVGRPKNSELAAKRHP